MCFSLTSSIINEKIRRIIRRITSSCINSSTIFLARTISEISVVKENTTTKRNPKLPSSISPLVLRGNKILTKKTSVIRKIIGIKIPENLSCIPINNPCPKKPTGRAAKNAIEKKSKILPVGYFFALYIKVNTNAPPTPPANESPGK